MPYPFMPQPLRSDINKIYKENLFEDPIKDDASQKSRGSKRSSILAGSCINGAISQGPGARLKGGQHSRESSNSDKSRTAQNTYRTRIAPSLSSDVVSERSLHNVKPSGSRRGSMSAFDHTNLSFSSPYKRPHFPLLNIQPDTHDVPEVPQHVNSDSSMTDPGALDFAARHISRHDTGRASFIINFRQGVQVFCDPEALFFINDLLASLQVRDSISVLDELQIDAMTEVIGADENTQKTLQTTEFRVYIPSLAARFRSNHHGINDGNSAISNRQECYDLRSGSLTAIARSSPELNSLKSRSGTPQLTLHVKLEKLEFFAREIVETQSDDQAVVSVVLAEPNFWITHGTTSAAEIRFSKLFVASASRKVDYISSLIRQTLVLSEDLRNRFTRLKVDRKLRFQLLMLLITIEGAETPDPLFLTRVSYVLRSASHHLRSDDSWKMLSRLRYIYQSLSEQARHRIDTRVADRLSSCPHDAAKRVIAGFDEWGTVDSIRARDTVVMHKAYGKALHKNTQKADEPLPIKAKLQIGAIEVLVEPGPNQNEITLQGLTVGLSLDQTMSAGKHSAAQTLGVLTSTIQVHCTELAVRLNWTLLGLLESVVETVRATTMPKSNARSMRGSRRLSRYQRYLHVVVSSDLGLLNCNTPNLKVVSLCSALRLSVATLQDTINPQNCATAILFDANKAASEVKTDSNMLTSYQLRQPKVFASQRGDLTKRILEPWRVVGTGQKVIFEILANPLQLIEAADCFVEQEVAHVLQWIRSLRIGPNEGRPSDSNSMGSRLSKVQIALSLESYDLSFKILPSLTYQIVGSTVETIIKKALRGRSHLDVDLNLKDHTHRFKTKETFHNTTGLLSELRMPPIDCALGLDLEAHCTRIEIRSFIQHINLDAAALHAIQSAVGRPEIISLGTSIKQEVSLLQVHYNAIFNVEKQNTQVDMQPTRSILYHANVILSGVTIQARTKDPCPIAQEAELHFKLNRLQLDTSNDDTQSNDKSKGPEIEAHIDSIEIALCRFVTDSVSPIPCGNLVLKAKLRGTWRENNLGQPIRAYQISSNTLQVNVSAETAPVVVALLVHLQDTLKTFDLSQEVQNLRKIGRARSRSRLHSLNGSERGADQVPEDTTLFSAMYSLEMTNICFIWSVERSISASPERQPENLTMSFTKIDLATRKENAARLLIENFQLQMVPSSRNPVDRSLNSALLPEVIFNVAYISTARDRRLAFQAVGKSLDLRLTSQFVLPASDLRRSIASSIQQVRTLSSVWKLSETASAGQEKQLFGKKKLASLLVDADFAGAVVYIQGQSVTDPQSLARNVLRGGRLPERGRYDQFTAENTSNSSTTLKAPGIAFKVEFKNTSLEDQSLNAQMKVHASSNILYPTIVPLIIEISSSVKDTLGESNEDRETSASTLPQPKFLEDERIRGGDPSAIFGHCRLNLGLQVCKQEFSLSCQPIARVAATARFEDIYVTVNTVQSSSHGKFFTISGAFSRLQVSVQHMYSRESTGSFEVDSIVVSLMNSKHISKRNGISAILNVSPIRAQINGKQSQDFLLFREIWVPSEIRGSTRATAPAATSEPEAFIVQRYQQIAATGAFPWNATISISELNVNVDLGQSLGKSTFVISQLWVSSKKSSDWEQNLCLGFDQIAVDSTGRMSGVIKLQDMKIRTSIQWPVMENAHTQTPLVQGSVTFDQLRVKAAFDYQAFAIADISSFQFLMYNVRGISDAGGDRLVASLDGDKVQVFCTTTSASQVVALYQAFDRLYQEKMAAYETSLRDIEKFLRRKSSASPVTMRARTKRQEDTQENGITAALKLHTDVVVSLRAINLGAFPSTFFDNQIFKIEALDASARFAVDLEDGKIHSTLGMTLGQLRVALSGITRASVPKALGEVSIADVVASATGSRGGTILKVPRLVASMETWQVPNSTNIDYIFKSTFQGKVDVGWNYSRISFIRGMGAHHARTLAQRLGKPLPQSAVQIKGGPRPEGDEGNQTDDDGNGGKITAVVNVPQSKYQYRALQPAIIDTPQLRDMGEATPPLEWIGLHRERLPNVTHQIVIVGLLGVAKEVDDAYSRILGSS